MSGPTNGGSSPGPRGRAPPPPARRVTPPPQQTPPKKDWPRWRRGSANR